MIIFHNYLVNSKRTIIACAIFLFVFGISSRLSAQQAYVEYGSVRGQVHLVFEGFDLALKQVPVYLIRTDEKFKTVFSALKAQIMPLLGKKDTMTFGSPEWITASENIIAVEKNRVILFRQNTERTIYADNQGLFAFHDVSPGNYIIFVEGAIKGKMTIWKAHLSLKAGQHIKLDFGSHNVGDTKEVYR